MPNMAIENLFDQILQGWDIPAPASLLRISAATANTQLEGHPYSIAINLAHAVFWQEFWLDKLRGLPSPSLMAMWKSDFRVPGPKEFPALRKQFLDGLEEARAYASVPDITPEAGKLLFQIAIHASYHLGQINLLKRAMKGAPLCKPDDVPV